jgi:hypothetical protein
MIPDYVTPYKRHENLHDEHNHQASIHLYPIDVLWNINSLLCSCPTIIDQKVAPYI